ncbi:hypothetical protein ACJW31_10G012300 [Castanea mollissima]
MEQSPSSIIPINNTCSSRPYRATSRQASTKQRRKLLTLRQLLEHIYHTKSQTHTQTPHNNNKKKEENNDNKDNSIKFVRSFCSHDLEKKKTQANNWKDR